MKLFGVKVSADYEFRGMSCSGGSSTTLTALIFAKTQERAEKMAMDGIKAAQKQGAYEGYYNFKLAEGTEEIPTDKEFFLLLV